MPVPVHFHCFRRRCRDARPHSAAFGMRLLPLLRVMLCLMSQALSWPFVAAAGWGTGPTNSTGCLPGWHHFLQASGSTSMSICMWASGVSSPATYSWVEAQALCRAQHPFGVVAELHSERDLAWAGHVMSAAVGTREWHWTGIMYNMSGAYCPISNCSLS